MSVRWMVAAGAVATVLLAGCGSGESDRESTAASESPSPTNAEPATFVVRGTLRVPIDVRAIVKEEKPTIGSTPCRAKDGYDDVRTGAQITIRNSQGVTVALGELGPGELGGEEGDMVITAPCFFPFNVEDVPMGEDFYSVEVAHRGELSYTGSEIFEFLELSLGD